MLKSLSQTVLLTSRLVVVAAHGVVTISCCCMQAMKADGQKKIATNKGVVDIHAQEGQALTSSLSGVPLHCCHLSGSIPTWPAVTFLCVYLIHTRVRVMRLGLWFWCFYCYILC